MARVPRRLHDSWEETHSTGFELCRHFFLRFFDSDLVSTPGQWRVVASGAIAIVLSFSLIYTQAYYHKYLGLHALETPEPYRQALLADVLFLVTLAMFLIGLFTTLLWPSLFPGLSDYLALASLPVRMRAVFAAKFSALAGFAGLFIISVNLLPSLILPAVMAGRHAAGISRQVPAMFVSSSLAALFVFFSLVAVQGVLLNVVPIRRFARISLAAQAALLTALLCGLPLVFSIPSLHRVVNQRPEWAVWVPPAWFLGLDQVMAGNFEPLATRLAWIGVCGVAGAAGAAISTYLWSYRRHRVRLLETPVTARKTAPREWLAALTDRFLPNPRELAVFAFVAKTLARSRQHRLVLTGFAALAIAVIFESFVSLALSRSFRGFSARTPALRQAAISAPLALSLFVLAGFRYLFRLPVELRANWVFRVNELGNLRAFHAAVQRFLLCYGVAPVALLTLPMETQMLGIGTGIAASILCLLPSLALMELFLIRFDKIPFTSSYLPGRRPLIETVVIYGVGLLLYVTVLGGIVTWSLQEPSSTLALFAVLLAAWWKARSARLQDWEMGKLEFEELPEPAVQTLSIERD
jgi:hypothetical protein